MTLCEPPVLQVLQSLRQKPGSSFNLSAFVRALYFSQARLRRLCFGLQTRSVTIYPTTALVISTNSRPVSHPVVSGAIVSMRRNARDKSAAAAKTAQKSGPTWTRQSTRGCSAQQPPRCTGDLEYARKLVIRVQGGEHAAQTPIQQQAFALRGWIDASIRQPRNKEEVALLKESIR